MAILGKSSEALQRFPAQSNLIWFLKGCWNWNVFINIILERSYIFCTFIPRKWIHPHTQNKWVIKEGMGIFKVLNTFRPNFPPRDIFTLFFFWIDVVAMLHHRHIWAPFRIFWCGLTSRSVKMGSLFCLWQRQTGKWATHISRARNCLLSSKWATRTLIYSRAKKLRHTSSAEL